MGSGGEVGCGFDSIAANHRRMYKHSAHNNQLILNGWDRFGVMCRLHPNPRIRTGSVHVTWAIFVSSWRASCANRTGYNRKRIILFVLMVNSNRERMLRGFDPIQNRLRQTATTQTTHSTSIWNCCNTPWASWALCNCVFVWKAQNVRLSSKVRVWMRHSFIIYSTQLIQFKTNPVHAAAEIGADISRSLHP